MSVLPPPPNNEPVPALAIPVLLKFGVAPKEVVPKPVVVPKRPCLGAVALDVLPNRDVCAG